MPYKILSLPKDPAIQIQHGLYRIVSEKVYDQYARYGHSDINVPGLTVACGLGGCGFGFMYGFDSLDGVADFAPTAEFLAALYRAAYNCGILHYSITKSQVVYSSTHRALKRIGAVQIGEHPNMYHGSTILQTWMVNVRDGVGLFYDEFGDPFKEEPSPMPPIPKFATRRTGTDFGKLPVRTTWALPVKTKKEI